MSERYKAVERSESGHDCCFEATVVDTQPLNPSFCGKPVWVCECYDIESAQKIVDALNTAHCNYEEELFCVRQDRDSHFGEMMRAIERLDALQAECEKLRGLLAEIGSGCSRRVMPSEQTIASWAEAIDAAIAEGEGVRGGGSNARA